MYYSQVILFIVKNFGIVIVRNNGKATIKGVQPIVNHSSVLGAAILNIVRNNYYGRSF